MPAVLCEGGVPFASPACGGALAERRGTHTAWLESDAVGLGVPAESGRLQPGRCGSARTAAPPQAGEASKGTLPYLRVSATRR
jgi:hypothetical protein